MQAELCRALADDLEALIRLHDRELDAETLQAMRASTFPLCLSLQPDDAQAAAAFSDLAASIENMPALDDLAADYASLYLNNRFGTSPYESVWLDEERLLCQQPMFELRQHYRQAGLGVADWRRRAEDHFVVQLDFLYRRLLDPGTGASGLPDFIDEHIGFWFADYASRVRQFAATDFYAGLAGVTLLWLKQFRELLAAIFDRPIPERSVIEHKIRSKLGQEKESVLPIKFMPGATGPSW